MLESGSIAPEFELQRIDGGGGTLSLQSGEGQPLLLAFFHIGCPVCQQTFPFLERLATASGGGLRVAGISQSDAAGTREFAEELGITFPLAVDPRGASYPASTAYRITNVPSLFLVEPSGGISLSVTGFSKAVLEQLGERAGVEVFTAQDRVPAFRPG